MNFSVKPAIFRIFAALLSGLLVLSAMPLRAIGESQVYRSVKTNSMQIAITFDDELVYWIHMGSNFHESVDVQWIVNAMGY